MSKKEAGRRFDVARMASVPEVPGAPCSTRNARLFHRGKHVSLISARYLPHRIVLPSAREGLKKNLLRDEKRRDRRQPLRRGRRRVTERAQGDIAHTGRISIGNIASSAVARHRA